MNILDPCSLSNAARESLRVGRKPKQVIFVYTLVLTALSLATTLLDYLLGLQVDQTTGLDNMEFNSLLSSFRSLLPVAQMVVSACLQLGYLWTMLRVSRKLYADAHDLKKGFSRVGPLVRCFLLKMALYMGLSFLLTMPASMLLSISPWANSLNELMPVMEDPNMAAALLTDPAAGNQLLLALLPMVIMFALVYLIVLIPVHFRLRMATYLLADDPQMGAMQALRTSAQMMRGNCLKLAKVDLHLWWWHGLNVGLSLLMYMDLILSLLGIQLPISAGSMEWISYGLFLAAQFAALYFLRNRTELVYTAAYESLRPKPQEGNKLVLGNIFQM